MPTVKIVCLANSYKTGGRCVAGKIYDRGDFGAWIRPVSNRPSRELRGNEFHYQASSEPQLLDVIELSLTAPAPNGCHQEDHLTDSTVTWQKSSELQFRDLTSALDKPATLWVNNSSSYNGLRDRMSVLEAAECQGSLYLVEPNGFRILVRTEGEEFDNPARKVRAKFAHAGQDYLLSVTDPKVLDAYKDRAEGDYPLQKRVYICVSVAEEYRSYHYKVVASVIEG